MIKNTPHPDYVAGEPIPRVTPRVDEVHLELGQSLIQWGRWGAGLVLVAITTLGFMDASFGLRLGVMIALLLGYIGIMFQPKHWRLMKQRRANMKRKTTPDQQWGLPIRMQVELICYQFVMVAMAQGFSDDGGVFGGLVKFFGFAGLLIGGTLIVFGFVAREPGQICCEECWYELIGLTLPNPCPECGHALMDISYTTDRPRVRSGGLFVAGGILLPMALASMYLGLFHPGAIYAPIPTQALIPIAINDRKMFEQLTSRELSEEQIEVLIDRLIDENQGDDAWDFTTTVQGRWLSQYAGTRMLGEARMDRIYRRLIESVEIDGPSVGRAGEELEIRIRANEVESPTHWMRPVVFVRGMMDEGGGVVVSGSDESISLSRLFEDQSPGWTWKPSAPGEYVIRYEVVLTLFPRRSPPQKIDWDAQASKFAIEPIWYRTVDLEHRVVVE